MGICIERTFDKSLILSILTDDGIWPLVSADDQPAEEFEVDVEMDDFYYLAVIKNELVIGLYVLHPFNSASLEIHANILPQYRKDFAAQSAEKVLQWFDENVSSEFQKLVARIPSLYPNVYHFTLKHGFQSEGYLINAVRKHGELHDLHLLGLQRKDLKDEKKWASATF